MVSPNDTPDESAVLRQRIAATYDEIAKSEATNAKLRASIARMEGALSVSRCVQRMLDKYGRRPEAIAAVVDGVMREVNRG